MSHDSSDTPGVIVFPPLIPLIVLVVGVAADLLISLGFLSPVPVVARIVIGLALIGIGMWLAISAERVMKRIGTNVNPFQPSLALAKQGIYGHMRNPMYVGMSLALLGVVVMFALEWAFILFVGSLLVLHFGVVMREERYLEAKFGDDYRDYKRSVPRYGWKR